MYEILYGLSEMETVSWISQVFPRRLSSFKLAKLFLESEQFSSSAYFSRFAIVGSKITAAQLWSSCTVTTPVGGSRLRWKLIICKQMYTCLEIGFPHLLSMLLLCQSSEYVYELDLPALVCFVFFSICMPCLCHAGCFSFPVKSHLVPLWKEQGENRIQMLLQVSVATFLHF